MSLVVGVVDDDDDDAAADKMILDLYILGRNFELLLVLFRR